MTTPIAPIVGSADFEPSTAVAGPRAGVQSFATMLLDGLDKVNSQVKAADAQVTAFALDDTVPPHRVMFALEEAQHAVTMMTQVRSRAGEAGQELMRMQL